MANVGIIIRDSMPSRQQIMVTSTKEEPFLLRIMLCTVLADGLYA